MKYLRLVVVPLLLLASCSLEDSHTAHQAETALLGTTEVDLQACLGAPDQHSSFGTTDILTYYATSTSISNFSLPVVGGFGFSNGGYCHAVIRVDNGIVAAVHYVGETSAFAAPDAYCAPIVRNCISKAKP